MQMNMTECVQPPVRPVHSHLNTLLIGHALGIVLTLILLTMSHGPASPIVPLITMPTLLQDIVLRTALHPIMPMLLIKHASLPVLMVTMLKIQPVLASKPAPIPSMLMLPPTSVSCYAPKPHRHMPIIMCV